MINHTSRVTLFTIINSLWVTYPLSRKTITSSTVIKAKLNTYLLQFLKTNNETSKFHVNYTEKKLSINILTNTFEIFL